MKSIQGLISGCLIMLAISGCATNSPNPTSNIQVPARDVPHLTVVMACGGCQVRPTLREMIGEGYAEAAGQSGARVVASEEATVLIKEYTARDDTARILVGAFAGKDEIKAVVTFKDKQFEVEDYYRNAWLGMNSLARKIGALVFEKLNQ